MYLGDFVSPGSGSLHVADEGEDFWTWLRRTHTRVPNPNTEGHEKEISPDTLKKYYSNPGPHAQAAKEIVERLRSQRSAPAEDPSGKQQAAFQKALASQVLVPNMDPNRYRGVKVEYGSPIEGEEVQQAFYDLTRNTAQKLGVTPEQLVLDLAGGGGLQGSLKEVGIFIAENRVMVTGHGDNIADMFRVVTFDKQGVPVSVLNKHLELEAEAPQGTGTRMLATQIASLKAAGGRKIQTTGAGCADCDYVGYYVWPLLGFEGEIPEEYVKEMPRWLIEELIDTGGDGPPFYLSEIMSFEEGREWWKEEGGEVALEFDVRNDEVLQRYAQKKARMQGKTVGQFLHNASQRKQKDLKKKSEKVEMAPRLDAQDLALLTEIWNQKSPRHRKKEMSKKRTAHALLALAQDKPEFRKALFQELNKEANFAQNVRDFTVDEFSQHQMLHNLETGDLIEFVYEPEEGSPRLSVSRSVLTRYDETLSGVELKGPDDKTELLVDQGPMKPLLWEPGPRKAARPLLKLRLVRSRLVSQ